jgi:hypothetical protein
LAPPAGAARFLLSRRHAPDLVREAARWSCSRVAREWGWARRGDPSDNPA